MNETCDPLAPPLSEQTEAVLASIVNVTARPDVAVAVTPCGVPPNFAPTGAAEVKLIVCCCLVLLHAGNLNAPIRVFQLPAEPLPVALKYSVVYQNVQSSLGSMLIDE